MSDNIVLYVKSEKIPIVQHTQAVPGHPCTGAFRAAQTIYNLKPEDQQAFDLLQEAGVSYKLVDLSNCSFSTQLKAKITGVNETPTLILNGQKIKGTENIKQALKGAKPRSSLNL